MRPASEEHAVVEYVRIHRLIEPSLLADAAESFAEDLVGRLEVAQVLVGRWWRREWYLGNIEIERVGDLPVSVEGRFGWFEEAPTSDAPPPYDAQSHQWRTEPERAKQGALALFAVNVESQVAAVTSLAGDVKMAGFCHALTDLLNQAEMEASRLARGTRPKREWLVEPIVERGTFEAWVAGVAKVTRVAASFHLPNPRASEEIEPVVEYLNQMGAGRGTLSAANPDGLDPFGHPMMRAAIGMQENDYGSVTAKGVRATGDADSYASRDHPARDTLDGSDLAGQFSGRRLAATLLRVLAARLERGLR